MVEKSRAIYQAKLRAIEAYKASKEFQVEIADSATSSFLTGFDLYKVQVAWLLPGVDVYCLNPKQSEDEFEAKEDGACADAISKMTSGDEDKEDDENVDTTPPILTPPILEVLDDETKEPQVSSNYLKIPPNVPLPSIEVQVDVEPEIEVATKEVM